MSATSPDTAEEVYFKFTKLRVAVIAMRDAQRNYFRTRAQTWLTKSKALEKRVDDILVEK